MPTSPRIPALAPVTRSVLLIAALLARTAAADEPAPPTVTVGGYVETYYQVNLRLPSNRITNLRGFDNRDRTFTLSNAAIDVKGERGPLAARVVLQIGATGATYYLGEPALPGAAANASGPELWRYLQQATVAYTTAGHIVVDAGLFPSPIGPEVLPVKDNWNWSRSDLFFGLPFYHTGVRVAVPLGGKWTGMLHAYNGWNSVVDNNPYPSVAVSAAYAGERVQGQLLYFGGIERSPGAPEGKPWRHLVDAYATIALGDRASMLVHGDAGVEANDLGTSRWATAALYGKLQLSGCLYAAMRADYFREWVAPGASALFWPVPWVASGTATLAYQPVDGITLRLEYRHDHADGAAYFGGDVAGDGVATPYQPNRRAQDTATLGVAAWF